MSNVYWKRHIRALSALTGRPVRIGPNDCIESVVLGDDSASIILLVTEVLETSTEVRSVARTRRLMMWSRTESDTAPWRLTIKLDQDDESFVPSVVKKWDYVINEPTLGDRADRLGWELLCGRPNDDNWFIKTRSPARASH